jgi:hypothetical protein
MAVETLTKAERKFISSAVLYNWSIEYMGSSDAAYWAGDKVFPVKVGVVCQGLILKGLLEVFNQGRTIKKTKAANAYKCENLYCKNGRIEVYKEDDDSYETKGDCPACDGIGVLKQPVIKS